MAPVDGLTVGSDISTISARDVYKRQTLSSRRFMVYDFSKDGRRVYGIFHNATDPNREWQLYEVSVTTGAETVSYTHLPGYAG